MHKLKDYQVLIALLITSFVSVYYMPAMLNRLIFIGILYSAYKTKLDYVYLVWFFIINDAPGRLFSAGEFGAVRIPLYPIAAGISISFQDLFLLTYIYKFIQLQKPLQFIYKKEFIWFFTFGCLVIAYSFLIGISFDNMIKTFRALMPWALILILPAFIQNRQILIRACHLIFPVVFLAFASQVHAYITGNYIDYYLRGAEFKSSLEAGAETVSRAYSAMYIILFSIIQALYLFFHRQTEINKNYLALVIFFGILSVFLTATRGWIIAVAVMLAGVWFLYGLSREFSRFFRIAVPVSVLLLLVVAYVPEIRLQIGGVYERLTTLEALLEGDVTAAGTLKRLDVRAPRVISKFKESPLLGWGFSDAYHEYGDGHVGHHNILLNIGIFGYIVVNGIFILLCMKIWRLSRERRVRIHEGKAPLIYVIGLIVVFVIHSSSTQFWGYYLHGGHFAKVCFLSFFFMAVNNSQKKRGCNIIYHPQIKFRQV